MAETNKKRLSKIARQKLALRDSLWPDVKRRELWERQTSDGWLSIPRAMPLLMQVMDNLSKGKPVSSTYIDLWCRAYDDSFVVANKAREMAFFSGFNGERAERTWASRIRILQELGFISVADGPNGPISYVLILNPYKIMQRHFDAGHINTATFNALKQRMIEIGAQDLEKLSEESDELDEKVEGKKSTTRKRPKRRSRPRLQSSE